MIYENIYDYLKEEHNIIPDEQNKILIAIAAYNDQKEDSRTEALEILLSKIHFWIGVIGIFFLAKIIAIAIIILCYGSVIFSIIDSMK